MRLCCSQVSQAIRKITEEQSTLIQEKERLILKLNDPGISLEEAKTAVLAFEGKCKASLSSFKGKVQEERDKKIEIEKQYFIEAKEEIRRHLYNTLKEKLTDFCNDEKNSAIKGIKIIKTDKKSVNVPTGIGER